MTQRDTTGRTMTPLPRLRRWMLSLVPLGGLMVLAGALVDEIPEGSFTVAPHEAPASEDQAEPGSAVAAAVSPPDMEIEEPGTAQVEAGGPAILPIDALSPEAANIAEAVEEDFAAVVYVPDEGRTYAFNGDQQFALMSVVKVPIMLAVMDHALDEKRALTPWEISHLSEMIRESSNTAAETLYGHIGGAAGMDRFLASVGLQHIRSEVSWGTTMASPTDVAALLAMLLKEEILDKTNRELALQLLGNVSPWQDWGAAAGVPQTSSYGIKNGWFPESWGWVLNSVAFVRPDRAPEYIIAVFSSGHLRMDDGIAAIEAFALAVNQEMATGR